MFKEIENRLDQTSNKSAADRLLKKFKLDKEQLSNGPVRFPMKAFTSARKLARLTIVKKEPFPAYEDLLPTNVHWVKFLTQSFVPTGAKTFGWPGFPPLPI